MTITFQPLQESHFPLLLKWLETDPDIANIKATRTYEKAGFKKIEMVKEGTVTWMVREKI